MMAQLVADGGEMTVGRKYGRFTYGSWDVKLPEGEQQADRDERQTDGYFYHDTSPRLGRSDFGCVRADAVIDATNGILKGHSNVEENIKNARKRAGGAVFFERDIENNGIGLYQPGTDFDVGDLVDVRLWGKRIALPVTSIEMTTSRASHLGWKVHVGGGLIADHEKLLKSNRSLESAIQAERRKTQKEVKRVTATSERAVSTVTKAKIQSDEAVSEALKAVGVAEAADLNSKQGMAQAIAANTAAARAVALSDAAQNKSIEALRETTKNTENLAKTNAEMLRLHEEAIRIANHIKIRSFWMDREASGESPDGMMFVQNGRFDSESHWRALGDWEGVIVAIIAYSNQPVFMRTKFVDANNRSWHEGWFSGSIQNTLFLYWRTDMP